ncbi:MAG: 1-deoxy-D-xylulose-5-phosphate reductoisomerase [Azospirillaceae bacterium]
MTRRRVSILGATGSVGRQTLDLVARNPDRFEVVALTARNRVSELAELAIRHRARVVAIADAARHAELRTALAGRSIEVLAGPEGLDEAARHDCDWTMAGIVGAEGLRPTLAAAAQGGILAFANKECLVSAGDLLLAEVRRHGTTLVPVDSEHNAIFQVWHDSHPVERIILTASGGPFRTLSRAEMADKTPAEAVSHPVWSMGAKISVDSATMMNKGLEIIEAHHLFGLPGERIEVLVHRQSVIHSMVEYADGSVLAQLGSPDMRIPIAFALAFPERIATPAARLDLARIARLDFEPPDEDRFPALALARQALAAGGLTPAVLNAANEVAVAAFLAGRLRFTEITDVAAAVMARAPTSRPGSVEDVLAADSEARRLATERCKSLA